MNWWIIEDAMRDRKGHWFEYLLTFRRGLERAGDQVRIFASCECEADVAATLDAEPILPRSIWALMGESAAKWKRLLRIFTHGWATYSAVSSIVKQQNQEPGTRSQASETRSQTSGTTHKERSTKNQEPGTRNKEPDMIFVPTVLVHHLLGWVLLLSWSLRGSKAKVILFFPNTPAFMDDEGIPRWNPDPSAKLFAFLIRRCAKAVQQGRLIIGAETAPMVAAMSELTGVPFRYLPHPVEPMGAGAERNEEVGQTIRFGAYGAARYEKGSELIQEAILRYLAEKPDPRVRFSLQWIADFSLPDGSRARLDPKLESHPQCEVIHEFFPEGGYETQIAKTEVMMLPYREAYRLRVSRVVIEAMQAGMPVIVARGTTLCQQAGVHGIAIECEQNDPASLVDAIRHAVDDFAVLQPNAMKAEESSREHFSVKTFRQLLLSHSHG